ncbi:MAG TPA: PhzF family phenazine biosynthesis isomerase [Steroidobacteraceae bacterium]|nr:PhzF family phenazine biosynthesis isomerase [Steroidobacteraceae bacterium]
MTQLRIFQVDAFTERPLTGNPAAVVLDAEGLTELQMRAVARELNTGDTAFVLPADAADHDLRVRFLTRQGEAAFVGHATLAVHAALAASGSEPRPRQKQRSGIVHVELLERGPPARMAVRLPPPRLLGAPAPAALAAALEALGLAPCALDARCPPWLAGASSTRLLIGVSEAGTLATLQPDLGRLAQLAGSLGAPGCFLFSLRPGLAGVQTEARMFCPALGIPEDPVSGNAHALLAIYLRERGLMAAEGFAGAQGHHMQRPGRVEIRLEEANGALRAVSIVGQATLAFAATLSL